jgi:hypothetical protein
LAVEKHAEAAEHLALSKRAEIAGLLDCPLEGEGSRTCAAAFIQKLGKRIFRRPLSAEEGEWLIGVFDRLREIESFESSLLGLVEVMLQSPQALYLAEYGTKISTASQSYQVLSGYERATRLSLFLWGTTPDEALLQAAAAGQLDTTEGVKTIARAMLDDERSYGLYQRFVRKWLALEGTSLHPGLQESFKDPQKFPEADARLFEAMLTEIDAFAKRLHEEEDQSYKQLWLSRDAYVNQDLANLYGVEFDQSGGEYQWLELPPSQRSGLLSRAGFLSLYAHGDYQSPILRGSFILENVFCSPAGEPPPNANDTPVTEGNADNNNQVRSVRESTTARTSDPVCAGCHSRINPMGFTFENYDALGRWQEQENHLDDRGETQTLAVDARGGFPNTDVVGEVVGGIEASDRFWQSQQVAHCFSDRWYRVALGNSKLSASECAPYEGAQTLKTTQNIRDLIVQVVSSDPFLHVNGSDAQAMDVQTSTRSGGSQ